MPDLEAVIFAADLAFEDVLINGPDGGRMEALEAAESELWWAQIAKRYAGWTGREGLLAQWDPEGAHGA